MIAKATKRRELEDAIDGDLENGLAQLGQQLVREGRALGKIPAKRSPTQTLEAMPCRKTAVRRNACYRSETSGEGADAWHWYGTALDRPW